MAYKLTYSTIHYYLLNYCREWTDSSDKIQSFLMKSFIMLVGWLVMSS